MARKNVSQAVKAELPKFYSLMFADPNAGVAYVLEAVPAVMRRTIAYELKGRFTPGELQFMLDVMNGTVLTPELAGQQLAASCADSLKLDDAGNKWGVDQEVFLDKLYSLSAFQLAALEIWAKGYWEGRVWEEGEEGVARWLKMLR